MFKRISEQFTAMFRRKAFLHWGKEFEKEEEWQKPETRTTVTTLQKVVEEQMRPATISQNYSAKENQCHMTCKHYGIKCFTRHFHFVVICL